MSTTNSQAGCERCNKSGLSLLLLRPSPVANDARLAPVGSQSVSSADGMVGGLVPARKPTESRYVLRMLRAGYVHVYIPTPPAGMKNWLVYRVTDASHLIAESDPVFNQMPQPPSCRRNGHNVAGMKLLLIPQAHRIASIWIAYSANLWNDKLKAQNAANPKAMQQVSLQSCGRNTFTPTVDALKSQVLECALGSYKAKGAQGAASEVEQDFLFVSMASEAQNIVANLRRAAACHPKTIGREMAVVLRDPVGVATELNSIRLRRNELAKAEMVKPENAWATTSLQMLEGLRRSALDDASERSWDAVSPLRTKDAFDASKGLPKGTEWIPLSAEERQALSKAASGTNWFSAALLNPYKRVFEQANPGRVVYPDHEERAARWVEQQTSAAFERWRKYVDEEAIKTWRDALGKRMQVEHAQPLARMESDWWAAREDDLFNDYFALHFDERDRNAPLQPHSPGATYTQEWQASTTPQPLAEGDVLERYLAELRKKPSDPTAIGWRALVGNQFELIPFVENYVTQRRQDKLHDLGAGLFSGLKEQLSTADLRYGWVAHASFAASSLTITQSWSAALAAAVKAVPLAADVSLITHALMVSQTLAMARESAVRGTWLKTPVRVSVSVPLREALSLIKERRAKASAVVQAAAANQTAMDTPAVKAAQQELATLPSNSSLKAAAGRRGDRLVSLSLLSDNHELARLGSDPRAALKAGAGQVAAGAGAAKLPATAATLLVSESQFAHMLARQPQRIQQAADAMRELAQLGKGGVLRIEGQIGLLGVWINGWGLVGNFEKWQETGSFLDMTNTLDSLAGVIAGTSQVAEAALSASLFNRLGGEAVKNALPILGLKAITSGAGAASGFAVMVGQGIKAARAFRGGDTGSAFSYVFSAASVAGFTTTSGIQFVGAFSDLMIARGSKAAIWRAGAGAVARVGARMAGTRILGLVAFGLTGWGLVFLTTGLVFEVVAIVLSPDALQQHVRRSRFGEGPDKYKSMKEEFDALDELLGKLTPRADAAQPSALHEPVVYAA